MTGKWITEETDKFLEYQGWTGQNTKWVWNNSTSKTSKPKKKKATAKTKVQDQMFSLDILSTI